MNSALIYLYFTKIKGTIRNIFSKAVSGILTIIGLVFFIGLAGMIFWEKSMFEEVSTIHDAHSAIMLYLGSIFFMSAILFLQKREALLFKNDANYLFSGPFKQKDILGFILAENLRQSLLFSIVIAFYLAMFASALTFVTPIFLLYTIVMSTIIFYIMLAIMTFFYIQGIVKPKTKYYRYYFIAILGLYVVGLFAKAYLANPGDIKLAVNAFLEDDLFYYMPLFGQAKYSAIGFANNDMLALFSGLGIIIVVAIVVHLLTINLKGDFHEQAIEDAEWASELKAAAKSGKTKKDFDGKVSEVKDAKFKSGAWSIASKNILDLKKTKSWLRPREIFLLLFYLGISYFIGMGFDFFKYYILIILLMSANTDFVVTELKKHYIYLIPDKPIKKIIALVAPMGIKMFFEVLFGLGAGYVLFRPSLNVFISSIFTILSYGLMFIAGSVWSIRLLKSGSNPVAEQLIKMVVILLACVPTVIVSIILAFKFGDVWGMELLQEYIAIIAMIMNGIMGAIFIIMAKGMLNGANVMAD